MAPIIDAEGREPDLLAKLSELTDSARLVVQETIAPALASIKAQIQTIETLLGTGADQAGNRDRLAGAFESLQRLSAGHGVGGGPEEDRGDPGLGPATCPGHLTEVSGTLGGSTDAVKGAVRQYGELAQEMRGLVQRQQAGPATLTGRHPIPVAGGLCRPDPDPQSISTT